MKKQKPYLVAIDYSPEQVERLKVFLATIGERSLKKFVLDAVENEITYRLEHTMKPEMRALAENVIAQRMCEYREQHKEPSAA